ncbi:MAG TPA: YeiH family protein [Pseudogracilibacillus sp.]|nr:YeiH family protein [Pseudogracilibacillus sp.]
MSEEVAGQKETIVPGLLFITAIAIVAYIIGSMYPIIGGAISGILIGIIINHFFGTKAKFLPGIDFTMKKLLKVGIVLLGFSFSFADIIAVGKSSIIIVMISVISGLTFTYYIGRLFGLKGNTALLIGSGTAICGATAIVTLSPVIKAKEEELTYAVNTIFAFNVLAILTFPFIATALGMSDYHFGIWAGAAIHDTSSVVAAGYAYSDEAGGVSVVVKLARTLMLIPLVIAVAIYQSMKAKEAGSIEGEGRVNILSVFPYFILYFVGVALFNTFVSLPTVIPDTAVSISKFLIVMVMVSVGLKTDIRKIRQVGYKPLIVGLIASVLISLISLTLIKWMV